MTRIEYEVGLRRMLRKNENVLRCNAPNFAVEFFSFLYSPKFGRYLSFSFSLAKP
jgi:hypothetical protein